MLLSVSQGYQFTANDAYQFGAQSFDVNLGFESGADVHAVDLAAGWGGVTILGAVDSLPLGLTGSPRAREPEEPGAGRRAGRLDRAALLRLRTGDERRRVLRAAPRRAAFFAVRRTNCITCTCSTAYAPIICCSARAPTCTLPIKGRIGVGVAGEFFDRRTFYQTPDVSPARFQFPQVRISLTWSGS